MTTHRSARLTFGGLLTCLGALFAVAYHDRYWRWRECFNELGRCVETFFEWRDEAPADSLVSRVFLAMREAQAVDRTTCSIE
jgi:hypothetical protein